MAFPIGIRSAGAPHLCPAITPPSKSTFLGCFLPFPEAFNRNFFPPSARREGGSALSARLGWLPRASPRIPPLLGGGSPRWEPPLVPVVPSPGVAIVSALLARCGAGVARGCGKTMGGEGRGGKRGEKGGGRSPRRLRAPARSVIGSRFNGSRSRLAQTHQLEGLEL